MYVTDKSTIIIAAKYGSNDFITPSIVVLAILQPVNNIVPTGGVIAPIQRLKQIIIPKCIGVIPKPVHIGMKIGVNINIAGVGP